MPVVGVLSRRTGVSRPTCGPMHGGGGKRGVGPTVGGPGGAGSRHQKRGRPPRGMFINHDDLAAMASGQTGVAMLKAMDRELDSLQRQVSSR